MGVINRGEKAMIADNGEYVNCVVDYCSEDDEIMITTPNEGKPLSLFINGAYKVFFMTEKGLFSYDAIVQNIIEHPLRFNLLLTLETQGEFVQRREYFRQECVLPYRFVSVMNESEEVNSDNMRIGTILDISGGGYRFTADVDLTTNTKIKGFTELCRFLVSIPGEILEVKQIVHNEKDYIYRAKFWDILKEDQDRVLKFILTEQRKRLMKRQE
ncbi:MAG: flagellar brake protein [Clostridiales bacterium]|nr:flagellar brake protein [Clostridiales bacterium]